MTKGWLWLLSGAVVGGSAALALAFATPTTYTSETQLYIATNGATSVADAFQGSQLAQSQVASYEQLLGGEQIARRVIDRLDLDMTPQQLLGLVDVSVPNATALLDLTVVDSSAARAQQIADAFGDEFIAEVDRLQTPLRDGTTPITIVRTQDAGLPTSPSRAQPVRNVVVGVLVGLVAGGAVAVARFRLDDSVRDGAGLSSAGGAPVLAGIPRTRRRRARRVLRLDGDVVAGAGFPELRSSLQLLTADAPPRTILVSSALPEEGRTTVAVNLAVALAVAGQRVAVVEADLRRPAMASRLVFDDAPAATAGHPGLTDVVSGQISLEKALHRGMGGRLTVLTAGTPVDDPDEVLVSSKMTALLVELRGAHDFVLVDAPPLLPVADAGVLASQVDGVVLLARHGRTSAEQVRACRAVLDRVGAVTLGAVLTFVPKRSRFTAGEPLGHASQPSPRAATTYVRRSDGTWVSRAS